MCLVFSVQKSMFSHGSFTFMFSPTCMPEKIQENLPAAGAIGLCSSLHLKSPVNTCCHSFYSKTTFSELQSYIFKKEMEQNRSNTNRITLKRLAQKDFPLEFALFADSDCKSLP